MLNGRRLICIQGMGGLKTFHGEYIEGSFRAHQVPLPGAKSDPEQLNALQGWLESYKPQELFDHNGSPISQILDIIPTEVKRIGLQPEANAICKPLDVPDWEQLAVKKGSQHSCMLAVGELLHDVIKRLASLHILSSAL